jgi:hypothetical protein
MIGSVSGAPRDELHWPFNVVQTTDPICCFATGANETLRCRLDETVVQTTAFSKASVRPFYGHARDR